MKNPVFRILYIPAFFLLLILSVAGCKKSSTTTSGITIPTITTDGTIINVTTTTAESGGEITSYGNGPTIVSGVCYSTTHSTPTIADDTTKNTLLRISITNATFTSSLSNLTPNTIYYVRAYATNSAGTGYGSVVKFTTSSSLTAVTATVTTLAGNGTAGYMDATGTSAQFNNPEGISVDNSGNIYVSDTYNNYIREVTPAGAVTTIAGNGTIGYVDGPAATAEFYAPMGSAFDSQGNLYVADFGNNVIRKITPAGVVSTFSGNGTAGFVDGSTAANIEYRSPTGLAFDAAGNLYVADRGNNVIRKITPAGVVSSLAGLPTGGAGYYNATDQAAAFNSPYAVVTDASSNVYVTDLKNSAIRKVTTPAGVVTTVAGGTSQTALLNLPTGMAIDKTGNFFIVDEGGRILEYTTSNVLYILAGSLNNAGYTDGTGAAAQFSDPQAIAVDANGNIYVADKNNSCIRKITVTLTN